ncbi:MAG: glycosyltransferase, partial [Ferruginibacter sp.]
IYTEHRWLKKTVVRNKIDAVISDNRFGMFHAEIPCIYITHQLSIKTGNRFTDRIAQKIHYRFINKFKECWVPDLKEEINLAGKLSHPVKFPHTPVKYIGPLSRFKKTDEEIKFDIAIILSGPEPQRTVFENIILKDLQNCSGKVLLIRGLPENSAALPVTRPDVQIHNHLPAEELNKAILQSALIISRAGYTTIMDLIKLQKKAILVPTPGQTEQEYLAAYLQQQKLFYYMLQEAFSIEGALKIAGSFSLCENSIPQNTYEAQLESFVNTFNNTGT